MMEDTKRRVVQGTGCTVVLEVAGYGVCIHFRPFLWRLMWHKSPFSGSYSFGLGPFHGWVSW